MAISTRTTGYAVTSEDWNELVNALNNQNSLDLTLKFNPPTGTTSAAVEVVNSSVGTPAPKWTNVLFDAGTAEYMTYPFEAPLNYASGQNVVIGFNGTATAGNVVFGAAIMGVGKEAINANFGTAVLGTFAVGGAGTRAYGTITLTDTGGLSAGDRGCLYIYRNGAATADTAGGDCKVDKVVLNYGM